MRKKTIAHKPPREKVYKLPSKHSTRSQDKTFTPSPSPPTSPPCTAPMARTKTTPRYLAPTKPTPPPKVTPSKPGSSKPGSSKPSSSKGIRPAAEELVSEPTQPKSRSVLVRSQRVKQQKGLTRSERVILDDEDDDFVPEDSPAPSTEGTSISTGKKSALLNVVKDVVQEFVSQSNHLITLSKEQRKLASKHENFLKKSRDRVAVFMSFIDNLQEDEDPVTDVEEEANSEGNGFDA
ncbi:proteoglycan 4-like [Arachis ipaensis]|uniref:proteoglycan 4-like n=1 Tax=Arachis ipaensis TaxID=130454 RepID=UPI0007AF898B|nr:proteoglycan 4-like [Arachis ipaensis]